MSSKPQIPWLLAALVLAAYSHCVYAHANEAADRHQQLRADEQPLDNTRATCENESSCICKGATLAVDVTVPAPETGLVDNVDIESFGAIPIHAAASSDRQTLPDHSDSLLFGRVLRAQLQRFLL